MAGGIDWFRWHHGSVTDPKFGLIAKKAGARVSDVIAVWAYVLENASAEADRGSIGELDFDSIDFLFGLEDGQAARIVDSMTQRGLIVDGRIASWDKRQPKREDSTAADRKRLQRERDHELRIANAQGQGVTDGESRDVTQRHANVTSSHDRGEERREEYSSAEAEGAEAPPSDPPAELCPHSEIIELYHSTLPAARRIRDWTPARQQALRARWREKAERQSLEWWRKFFAYVEKSDFLCGRVQSSNRKPFELSLDWLCKSENFVKVLEGAYEN